MLYNPMQEPFEDISLKDYGHTLDTAVLALLEPPALPDNDLELPGWIWRAMALAYGVFFTGLWLAAGHGGAAIFALVVSIGYAAMYFGTARILIRQSQPAGRSLFARGLSHLQTWTGPMNQRAVAAQVLAIPIALAIFGASFAVASAALS